MLNTPLDFDGCRKALIEFIENDALLDDGIKPILDQINQHPHIVSLFSCTGHDSKGAQAAYVDVMVRDKSTWTAIQTHAEELLEAGALRVGFDVRRVSNMSLRFPGTRYCFSSHATRSRQKRAPCGTNETG